MSEMSVLIVKDASLSSLLGIEIIRGRNHRSAKKGGYNVDVYNCDAC